jgi:hypothetical protein
VAALVEADALQAGGIPRRVGAFARADHALAPLLDSVASDDLHIGLALGPPAAFVAG